MSDIILTGDLAHLSKILAKPDANSVNGKAIDATNKLVKPVVFEALTMEKFQNGVGKISISLNGVLTEFEMKASFNLPKASIVKLQASANMEVRVNQENAANFNVRILEINGRKPYPSTKEISQTNNNFDIAILKSNKSAISSLFDNLQNSPLNQASKEQATGKFSNQGEAQYASRAMDIVSLSGHNSSKFAAKLGNIDNLTASNINNLKQLFLNSNLANNPNIRRINDYFSGLDMAGKNMAGKHLSPTENNLSELKFKFQIMPQQSESGGMANNFPSIKADVRLASPSGTALLIQTNLGNFILNSGENSAKILNNFIGQQINLNILDIDVMDATNTQNKTGNTQNPDILKKISHHPSIFPNALSSGGFATSATERANYLSQQLAGVLPMVNSAMQAATGGAISDNFKAFGNEIKDGNSFFLKSFLFLLNLSSLSAGRSGKNDAIASNLIGAMMEEIENKTLKKELKDFLSKNNPTDALKIDASKMEAPKTDMLKMGQQQQASKSQNYNLLAIPFFDENQGEIRHFEVYYQNIKDGKEEHQNNAASRRFAIKFTSQATENAVIEGFMLTTGINANKMVYLNVKSEKELTKTMQYELKAIFENALKNFSLEGGINFLKTDNIQNYTPEFFNNHSHNIGNNLSNDISV